MMRARLGSVVIERSRNPDINLSKKLGHSMNRFCHITQAPVSLRAPEPQLRPLHHKVTSIKRNITSGY